MCTDLLQHSGKFGLIAITQTQRTFKRLRTSSGIVLYRVLTGRGLTVCQRERLTVGVGSLCLWNRLSSVLSSHSTWAALQGEWDRNDQQLKLGELWT